MARPAIQSFLLQIEVHRALDDGKLFPVAVIIRDGLGLSLTPPELFGFGEHAESDAAIDKAVQELKARVESWYSQPGMPPMKLEWLPDVDAAQAALPARR